MPKQHTRAEDKSPKIAQHKKVETKLTIREFPWSDNQKEFMSLIDRKDSNIVLCKGPAGTAKTLCAVYSALRALAEKRIGQIAYVRTIVESSSHPLGYLKGTIEEKIDPYLQPLLEKMDELLPQSEISNLIQNGFVTGIPVGFLRGRQINVAHVIVDEAQNLSCQEALLTITRCGKRSKIIMIGDIRQSDVRNGCFEDVYDLFDNDAAKEKGIYTFKFGLEDIFRNEVLKYVIEQFETLEANRR